jgi:lanthionine synthetase-like protein
MTLFEPERHEALTEERWDSRKAASTIREIVADTLAAERDGFWRPHPLDDDAPANGSTIYLGTAGVAWGLSYLARGGAVDADPAVARWALELPARYRAAPDTGEVVPSFFLGESGVLLTAARTEARKDWLDRLHASIASNTGNPTLEALWGAPGTMIAAVLAHEIEPHARWRSVHAAGADALRRTWLRHDGDSCDLWMQDLYGRRVKYLGPAHGFAGNVYALLRPSWLTAEDRSAILERAVATLRAMALVDGACANWPPAVGGGRALLVQWCHGAPGIVTAFAAAPAHAELDDLLAKGGELTWSAGPLRKGPGLCHGTAGNGAAFLALFARTGNELWLERARCFAMHAIRQVAEARSRHGQGRYTLWTGDIGVAVYLEQCLAAKSGLPTLDF